jgi:tryptophan synthase alpha subunit
MRRPAKGAVVVGFPIRPIQSAEDLVENTDGVILRDHVIKGGIE